MRQVYFHATFDKRNENDTYDKWRDVNDNVLQLQISQRELAGKLDGIRFPISRIYMLYNNQTNNATLRSNWPRRKSDSAIIRINVTTFALLCKTRACNLREKKARKTSDTRSFVDDAIKLPSIESRLLIGEITAKRLVR
jgi:hypothetical protein